MQYFVSNKRTYNFCQYVINRLKITMNDNSRRPLQIPSWHIPYMEKHRMYELFHELARELVIQQPEDHIAFMKQILYTTSQNRDNARVVIIGPPNSNCDKVAHRISMITNQVVITNNEIENASHMSRRDLTPALVAKCISHLVRREKAYKMGWILINCIKNEDEAKALLQAGILPTLALYLVSPFYPDIDELKYCHVPVGWPESRRQLVALRDSFKHILVEVHLKQLTPEEVATTCVELIGIRKAKISIVPRIVLFGPRGSGRKTQAEMLASQFNLVHIDFEYLLCQTWKAEFDLSAKLRECGERVCFHSEILVTMLNKRILDEDCLSKGWVLTGFPFCVGDFMYLDCVDTPPNRVIFLECDLNVCTERVIHNRVNTVTGSITHIRNDPKSVNEKQLELHPKDKSNLVTAEHSFYCIQYPLLKEYCAGTEFIVNSNQQPRWVYECIVGIIVRESKPCPPRRPFDKEEMPQAPSILTTDSLCCCGPIPPKVLGMYSTHV